MHSIAHHIINNRPDLRVLYVTSEKFTNELIDSLKHDKNKEFRDKYRNIDVLLIDDIQFIIGKKVLRKNFSILLMNFTKQKTDCNFFR